MNDSLDPFEHVGRLIAGGRISRDDVERALAFWRRHLASGLTLPNGVFVRVTARDLHHYLAGDDRILRKPERIERLLRGVFEIRTTHSSREVALSHWREQEGVRFGYAILTAHAQVWTMHVTDERDIIRRQRKGDLRWRS